MTTNNQLNSLHIQTVFLISILILSSHLCLGLVIKVSSSGLPTIFYGSTVRVGQGLLIVEVSRSHSVTPQSIGLLWTSDQPVAGTSTWQHTALTRDRHPCSRRVSNPYPSKRPAATPCIRSRDLRGRLPVKYFKLFSRLLCLQLAPPLYPALVRYRLWNPRSR